MLAWGAVSASLAEFAEAIAFVIIYIVGIALASIIWGFYKNKKKTLIEYTLSTIVFK
jgi:hypothetical protein